MHTAWDIRDSTAENRKKKHTGRKRYMIHERYNEKAYLIADADELKLSNSLSDSQ